MFLPLVLSNYRLLVHALRGDGSLDLRNSVAIRVEWGDIGPVWGKFRFLDCWEWVDVGSSDVDSYSVCTDT